MRRMLSILTLVSVAVASTACVQDDLSPSHPYYLGDEDSDEDGTESGETGEDQHEHDDGDVPPDAGAEEQGEPATGGTDSAPGDEDTGGEPTPKPEDADPPRDPRRPDGSHP